MRQAELERAVACATGEPVREVQRLGFSLWVPSVEEGPNVIDWDDFRPHSVGLFPSSDVAHRDVGPAV